LAEYDRACAEDALDRRTKARAAAANPPAPSPPPAPTIQIARWLKGESHEEFVKRCSTHAVSLRYLEATIKGLRTVLGETWRELNARNLERNERLTSLETRLASAEARLGGHSGSAMDERLAFN
jgi:hypothetical protein